ncbi:hypothetical protein Tco_1509930 [Tanacetum coccineum]
MRRIRIVFYFKFCVELIGWLLCGSFLVHGIGYFTCSSLKWPVIVDAMTHWLDHLWSCRGSVDCSNLPIGLLDVQILRNLGFWVGSLSYIGCRLSAPWDGTGALKCARRCGVERRIVWIWSGRGAFGAVWPFLTGSLVLSG